MQSAGVPTAAPSGNGLGLLLISSFTVVVVRFIRFKCIPCPDYLGMYKCDAISCSESCGLSVPIALYDMHECEIKENVKKKPKPHFENGNVKEQRIRDQPRSAFRFFMYVFYFPFLIFVTVSDLCSFI